MSDNTNYVQSVLGGLSGTVGWDLGSVQLVVDDALLLYGVSTEAEMDNELKKKVLLQYATWKRVRNEFVLDFDWSGDGESFHRSQMVKQLNDLVAEAEAKASPYLADAEITQDYVDLGYSPYRRST